MTNAVPSARSSDALVQHGENPSTKPAFELILSGLESTPAGEPFDPEQIKRLNGLNAAAQEHYSRILTGVLGADTGSPGLPTAVMRGAQMLHRRLANALGQAALRLALRPRLADEQSKLKVAELAADALNARTEEIKWHAFERTTPHAESWRNTNALYLGVESIGVERAMLADGRTCIDAFAQCMLLATLNVGILSAPQMELAHRWLAISGFGLRVEPSFDPEAHWYQIDLELPRGPERVSQDSAISDTTRFIAVSALGTALAQARAKLYVGELSVGATPNRIAALHFGAFLDLAERLWSSDWRKQSWRSPRTRVDNEHIEVAIGFEKVLEAIGADDDSNTFTAHTNWMLHDRSDGGLGALVPENAGIMVLPGVLIAFRASEDEDWELGSVVRRVRSADETHWLIGIKRISATPVALRLQAQAGTPEPETATAPAAIYASVSAGSGRSDSLLLSARDFSSTTEYKLPTGGGVFRISLNRVIERGESWVRVGFEVMGKQQAARQRHTSSAGAERTAER
jgi:hypothetical protein